MRWGDEGKKEREKRGKKDEDRGLRIRENGGRKEGRKRWIERREKGRLRDCGKRFGGLISVAGFLVPVLIGNY
ncbi:MAG: hypothetical protein KAT34_21985 [Candidatus Aminicenantes bacterium]|nr:hypothetical protein [Candidatus Aminicenantes bacterium]